MKTIDFALDSRIYALFKGDPGTGKSIAAASFPKPYFFALDGNIKAPIAYWRPRGKEFEYDFYSTFLSINKKLEEFNAYCPYETIVIDGITSLADIIINDMIRTRDPGAKKVMRAGIESAQIEDYGGEARGLQVILDNLKAVSINRGIHAIVTAHVIQVESTDLVKKTTSVSRQLLTAGNKVAVKLPKDFDEAYHFDVQGNMDITQDPIYTVVTKNTGYDWAKTALPLPTRIKFTNGSLYDIIMSHLKDYPHVHSVNSSAVANQANSANPESNPTPSSDASKLVGDMFKKKSWNI